MENNDKGEFNWRLPLYGAVGFGIGFAILGAVMGAILTGFYFNFFFETIHYILMIVALAVSFTIIGAVGGASLGLALKDNSNIFNLSVLGAVGFAAGFCMLVAIMYMVQSTINAREIDWIIFLFVIGIALMGAVGGAALGIALKDKKKAFYLAGVNIIIFILGITVWISLWTVIRQDIWFNPWSINKPDITSISGLIELTLFDTLWFAFWGCIGGFALGLILANMIKEKKKIIKPAPESKSAEKFSIDTRNKRLLTILAVTMLIIIILFSCVAIVAIPWLKDAQKALDQKNRQFHCGNACMTQNIEEEKKAYADEYNECAKECQSNVSAKFLSVDCQIKGTHKFNKK